MSERRRQILEAALAIADEQGLPAVSMRAVAERVGLSAMAIYPHVGSKAALLDGLVEVLLSRLDSSAGGAEAWECLTVMAEGLRGLAARHPGAFELLLARPSLTPDAVRVVDRIHRALLDLGVPQAHVPRLERLFSTFVIGFAASEVNGRFGAGDLAPRGRRAQVASGEVLAHHRLGAHPDRPVDPVDWDAEFKADLEDLRAVVEAVRGRE